MKHEFKIIPKEEVLANRSNAYEFINFDKQETLEEALNKFVRTMLLDQSVYIDFLQCAEFGAKWQQEQDKKMYSEEEVRNAIDYGANLGLEQDIGNSFEWTRKQNKWFEQFKKK